VRSLRITTAVKEILATEDQIDRSGRAPISRRPRYELAIIVIAALVFLGCIISPPSLMDDVDAAHGQLARNMIHSGDWVVPHLNGVAYLEKPPLPYWMIAIAYRIFGVHDWVARLPFALAAILLCRITGLYGCWAFSRRAGFYAGVVLATCIGLFLFTRILIPDVIVALCVALSFWSFQRALNEEEEELHPRRWAALLAAAMGVGVMLKGLRLGTCWLRSVCRHTSISRCTAALVNITAFSGFISSMSTYFVFWGCATRTITTPFRERLSGCLPCCGFFPGAPTCLQR
jgi:hypothetical protein